ncbi:MAG TPA: hypothetical protein VJX48_03450 [Xanthobacteraceae bacterium]|nr:hypothetical protein [Xanthobacteraceae bacterium]
MRVLNFVVIGALVLAAAYVYRIKFDSTVQAEHLAKLRGEVRRERDAIAAVRAEWGQLDNPARIEALARRFLQLKPIAPTQFDRLDHLPERPPEDARAASDDPIGGMIGNLAAPDMVTGSIPAATTTQSDRTSGAPVPAPAADQTESSAASGAPSR